MARYLIKHRINFTLTPGDATGHRGPSFGSRKVVFYQQTEEMGSSKQYVLWLPTGAGIRGFAWLQ